MGKRLGFVLVCLLFSIGIAVAQNTVSGTVLGDDGLPVIGATVMVKGTKTGTATDIDGNFSISTTEAHPQLVVSYVGMKTLTVKGASNMKITLEADVDSHQLGEVVVTGMQKMDKRLFTGAATKVDAEKAKLDGVADISRSLEGRAERLWYLWYGTEDSCPWCYFYLWFFQAALGGRWCHHGGCD